MSTHAQNQVSEAGLHRSISPLAIEEQLPAHQKAPLENLVHLLEAASSTLAGTSIHNDCCLNDCAVPNVNRISYAQLLCQSKSCAPLIYDAFGGTRDRIVLLYFDTHLENLQWFWTVAYSELIPAILPPLAPLHHQRDQQLRHLKSLLHDPIILTSEKLATQVPEFEHLSLQTVESLHDGHHVKSPEASNMVKIDRPAVIMLTSGSTGNAKAVPLTFPQILRSIQSKSEALDSTAKSIFLNWIGLDHVANLTEIHLQAMLLGAEQIHVQASDLLSDPLLFLRIISKHRVSHTFAPNFFLALLDKQLAEVDSQNAVLDLDLSCLRTIVSGGEANPVQTAKTLTTRLHSFGAKGQIICLGYGLTEASAALTYGVLDPAYEEQEGHEFASVGKPITGAQVRIRGATGLPAEPNEVGDLELSGPVVFRGYYNDLASTEKAFTEDGWFITGDTGYIDTNGRLNLAGRTKDVIVINGAKYFPHDIEAAIEKENIPGVIPSYIAAFSHRPKNSHTEGYCIIYSSAQAQGSLEANGQTMIALSKVASSLVGLKPEWVIAVSRTRLNKSSLGKLSRSKIQAEFEQGLFDDAKTEATRIMEEFARQKFQPPQTPTEIKVVQVLSEMLAIAADTVSTHSTVFELGITSLTLFRFEQTLRRSLNLDRGVSIITFLSNPVISSIAHAIDNQHSRTYNPVVQLQTQGTKTPLWLVHPASGNVLAFLPLARTIVDRPLYALTARGLSSGETLFSSIAEMADTYYTHLKRVQPDGPYALTGYSLGTTVAYELAKRLEANGDAVAFCGALDSPPHVIPLVAPLDWTAAAVLVSYFVELIPQTQVPELIAALRGKTSGKLDTINSILAIARPEQREALNLDPEQLLAIVDVTDNFGTMAKKYHPEGNVAKVDVFFCTPLHHVEINREKWLEDHLRSWQDFSREGIELHECEGDHADMLNPTFVKGFAKRLEGVLGARGL